MVKYFPGLPTTKDSLLLFFLLNMASHVIQG
jgi:hypothetical protein